MFRRLPLAILCAVNTLGKRIRTWRGPGPEILLTAGDAAGRLGVCSGRVHQFFRHGQLPAVGRTPRGWVLFALEDVERLRAEREQRRKRSDLVAPRL